MAQKNCRVRKIFIFRVLSHQARNQEVIHYNEDTISRAHKINANSDFFLIIALIAGSRFSDRLQDNKKKIKLCKFWVTETSSKMCC